jgi:hypothetical protein
MPRPALSALLPVALTLSAAPVFALPWDGTYRLSPEADCARVGQEGGALRIAEGALHGVEATCEMTAPVDIVDMEATIYTMDCAGEGERWTERAILMEAAEGDAIFVIWNGYAFRYERCPAGEGAEVAADEAAEEPAPEGAGDAPEDATAD